MTPIPPLENRRVHGVAARQYPLNKICAHPECKEPAVDPHHCFARSQIASDSWFVEIEDEETAGVVYPFPHVTGLCRAHHNDVEEHRAWIKLEDGRFVWYDLHVEHDYAERPPLAPEYLGPRDDWKELGPLNPQPGSQEGKPKRPRYKGEQRRKRQTLTLRVPHDAAEDGAGILDDLHEQVEERLGHSPPRPLYNTTVDAFNFVLLNTDATDVGTDEP